MKRLALFAVVLGGCASAHPLSGNKAPPAAQKKAASHPSTTTTTKAAAKPQVWPPASTNWFHLVGSWVEIVSPQKQKIDMAVMETNTDTDYGPDCYFVVIGPNGLPQIGPKTDCP